MAGNPDTVAAALRHLNMGFAVIPVATGGKKPTMKDWAQHPVTDPKMATTFLGNPGTQNYGLTMPRDSAVTVIVLDLDDGDGATRPWRDRIREQITAIGPLPPTKATNTPSGGRHLFFAWPGKPPKGDQFLGWTLRVLNQRHMVVGPGSVTKDGVYIEPDPEAIIYEMPEAWVKAFNETVPAPKATLRDIVEPHGPLITIPEESIGYEMPAAVTEGGRYAAIRDFVASRWNRGISEEEMWDLVRTTLASRFTVPLTEEQLRERFDRTLQGISSRLGTPAALAIEAEAPKVVLEASAKDVSASPTSLIVPISTYRASVPTAIPWIVEGFAYRGGVTLLSGSPKAGKSSLSANLQRCRESSDLFLGSLSVPNGPTLLVTEEGGIPVVYKTGGLSELMVLDRKAFVLAGMSEEKKPGEAWVKVINVVADWAEVNPEALIFIDTLAIWAGLRDENDASAVTTALGHVATLAQARDCAIVLVHHTRKGGGDNGEAIRGSGAMLATVDLSLELTRTDETDTDDRWLDIQGRVVMPQRMRLAFDRATLTYTAVDAQIRKSEADEKLIAAFPTKIAGKTATVEGLKVRDIATAWGVALKTARQRLDALENRGLVAFAEMDTGRGGMKARVYWRLVPEATRSSALIRVGSTTVTEDDDED